MVELEEYELLGFTSNLQNSLRLPDSVLQPFLHRQLPGYNGNWEIGEINLVLLGYVNNYDILATL